MKCKNERVKDVDASHQHASSTSGASRIVEPSLLVRGRNCICMISNHTTSYKFKEVEEAPAHLDQCCLIPCRANTALLTLPHVRVAVPMLDILR